jgi:hypothetical protein
MVTEKYNSNTKYSCLSTITVFVTIFVRQFAVCLAIIWKLPNMDAKVLELVLKCTKSNLYKQTSY